MLVLKSGTKYQKIQVWIDNKEEVTNLDERKSFLVTFPNGHIFQDRCELFSTFQTQDEFGEIYLVGRYIYKDLVDVLTNNSSLEIEEKLKEKKI